MSDNTKVRITDINGVVHELDMNDPTSEVFKMVKLCQNYNVSSKIIENYIKMVSEFWSEIYQSQKDIESSDDAYDDELSITAYLSSVMSDVLSIEGLAKHFEVWLIKKVKADN